MKMEFRTGRSCGRAGKIGGAVGLAAGIAFTWLSVGNAAAQNPPGESSVESFPIDKALTPADLGKFRESAASPSRKSAGATPRGKRSAPKLSKPGAHGIATSSRDGPKSRQRKALATITSTVVIEKQVKTP